MPNYDNKKAASEAGKKSRRGKSKKTLQWEQLGEFITKEGAEKYMKIVKELPDKDFMDRFENLLEYFKPKMIRSDNTNTTDVNLRIVDESE